MGLIGNFDGPFQFQRLGVSRVPKLLGLTVNPQLATIWSVYPGEDVHQR